MILIDGVKYEPWTPPSEDEFEKLVSQHAEEIFGKDAKYFDLKHKLASKAGTGSIPDGYVITLGDKPQVQIVELELASHTLQHIVSQMVNIINGIENPTTQQKICNTIEDGVNEDEIFAAKIAKATKPVAIHRFLSDGFSNTLPTINIIIDKSSTALEEAIGKIAPPPKIIEFQTLTRENVGLAVHAHLFKPLYAESSSDGPRAGVIKIGTQKEEGQRSGKRVTVKDLIDANMVKIGQVIYRSYNGRRFEGRILSDGNVELLHNGKKLSLNRAASDVTGGAVDAWTWWYILRENGEECLLDECRKEYLSKQSS